MEEFIVGETKKIFNKAIKRYSQRDGIHEEFVSILLSLVDDGEDNVVCYEICHEHHPVRKVSIMDILGVKIDLKGYSILVPPQIKKILENFCIERNSDKVEVCVYLDREDKSEVIYFLFDNGQLVRQFELKDVLKIEVPA